MTDIMLNLRAIKGRAYPRAIGGLREPSWMFFDIVLPLLGIAAFIYYYRSLGAPEIFEGYVVIGGAMTAYWLNVLWSMATQFYWEKEKGKLELYMMAPMSKMSAVMGVLPVSDFGLGRRAAICATSIPRPARRAISSALRLSTLKVPPPTVPNPQIPTLTGFTLKLPIITAIKAGH